MYFPPDQYPRQRPSVTGIDKVGAEVLRSWCSNPLHSTATVTLDAHLSWLIMRTVYQYQALATEVLRTNTSLVVLNLESNRITRKGIKVPQYCSMQHRT